MKKVVVAISGGLDSAMAAYLLQRQKYQITGVFMRLGEFSRASEMAARAVCNFLNIKFYPINFSSIFQKKVIDYFLNTYQNGLTPNPCVVCNQFIKFGALWEFSKNIKAQYLASGHYLKIKKKQNKFSLHRARDAQKDQSYFLYNLDQDRLARLLFPLGDYLKSDIRTQALKLKIPFITKESQDICFISGDHNDLLKEKLKLRSGDIVLSHENGKQEKIGEHAGLPLYTLGQRKGIEIGGAGPFYVLDKDYQKNILYVSSLAQDARLYKSEIEMRDIHWISGELPSLPLRVQAKMRCGQKDFDCVVLAGEEEKYKIKFNEAQRAVTRGQSMVFYDWESGEVLGGGVI